MKDKSTRRMFMRTVGAVAALVLGATLSFNLSAGSDAAAEHEALLDDLTVRIPIGRLWG